MVILRSEKSGNMSHDDLNFTTVHFLMSQGLRMKVAPPRGDRFGQGTALKFKDDT